MPQGAPAVIKGGKVQMTYTIAINLKKNKL